MLANHLFQDQGLPIDNLMIPPICSEFYVLLESAEASSFIQQILFSGHHFQTLF